MDCEIKLGGGSPRERRARKITRTTAIVNNENAMTKSATCWPAEAAASGGGIGLGAGVRTGRFGALATVCGAGEKVGTATGTPAGPTGALAVAAGAGRGAAATGEGRGADAGAGAVEILA